MQGADRIWRTYRPPLPHEKAAQDHTSAETILGLVAIEAGWTAHGASYVQVFTEKEAERAVRYALDELNGFPPWFEALASAHEGIVATVLGDALRGEWQSFSEDAQFRAPTLQRLLGTKDLLNPWCMPTLKSLLMGEPATNTQVILDALRVALRASELPKEWLVPVALARLAGTTLIGEKVSPWLSCLFLLDADQGFDLLEQRFEPLSGVQRDALCQALCAQLHGDFLWPRSEPRPDYERPAFLRRFIPWVYRHVRVAEDAALEGVADSNDRDDAELFRSSLIARLQENPQTEAGDVLAELANDPDLSGIRDFILMKIDERRAEQADDFVIVPADVHALRDARQRVPRNRADLFHTAFSRLKNFKEHVESAEISLRHHCHSGWSESEYQGWLQKHMQETARGMYTIPSEAQVDPGKFPDLRFEAPGVDGAVSVEVKVATFEHWSYTELERCLRHQLVGQYLRAANAKHGVFLLFRANKVRRWSPSIGSDLDWQLLLRRLNEVAEEILIARPNIERLEVLGIDVTAPEL